MQHGFWEDFSAVHFLDMRHMRNLIGHTDDFEGKDVLRLTGDVQSLQTAIQRTKFPANAHIGSCAIQYISHRTCPNPAPPLISTTGSICLGTGRVERSD